MLYTTQMHKLILFSKLPRVGILMEDRHTEPSNISQQKQCKRINGSCVQTQQK